MITDTWHDGPIPPIGQLMQHVPIDSGPWSVTPVSGQPDAYRMVQLHPHVQHIQYVQHAYRITTYHSHVSPVRTATLVITIILVFVAARFARTFIRRFRDNH